MPTGEGEAFGPPNASATALEEIADEWVLTYIGSETGQLLLTAFGGGLSDPYSAAQGGWILGQQEVNPYTNAPMSDTVLGPFVGVDVDPYTNAVGDGANPNAYVGGDNVDSYSGLQPTSLSTSGGSPMLAFGIASSTAGSGWPIAAQEIYDENGNFVANRYVYSDGSTIDVPFDGGPNVLHDPNTVVIESSKVPSTPPQLSASAQAPILTPEQLPSQNPPQLAPPVVAPPSLQPPQTPRVTTPVPSGPVQTLTEMVIAGERPFSPDVSHPAALEAAEGRGRVEMGDLSQLVKGGYNGLVELPRLVMRAQLPPGLQNANIPSTIDYIPRAPIDPRYGGAAIMGEQLAQNLALEAATALPVLGRAVTKTAGKARVYNTMFRKFALREITQAEGGHLLDFLIDPTTGEFYLGNLHTPDPVWEAGHAVSLHSGAPELLLIEDSMFNQLSSHVGESRGHIFQKSGVVIGGLPVELRSALMYESLGLLPEGTVRAAPYTVGWSAETRSLRFSF